MSHQSIKSELFVELSEEQQQLVAGGTGDSGDTGGAGGMGGMGGMGGGIGSLKDKLSTYYNTNGLGLGLNVAQGSTPQGSFNQQNFTTEVLNINTAAFKDLFAQLTPN